MRFKYISNILLINLALSPGKLLFFDYEHTPQEKLDNVLQNYSMFRDCHTNCPSLVRFANVASTLASKFNATLKSGSVFYKQRDLGPSFAPSSRLSHFSYVYDFYRNKTPNHLPTLFHDGTKFYNFLYCARPELESPWDFKLFLPFDRWTCLSLIVIMTLCSIITKTHIAWYAVALMAQGPARLRKVRLYFPTYPLWLLLSFYVATLYLVEITSVLTIPPKEKSFKDLEELTSNKYDLDVGTWEDISDLSSSPLLQSLQTSSATKKAFEILFKKLGPWRPSYDFYLLIYGYISGKVALLAEWSLILSYAKQMSQMPKFGLHCYVGEEFISTGDIYIGFYPPEATRWLEIFQGIVESGIYGRWVDEADAVKYSKRVQDRVSVRTIGRLEVIEQFRNQAPLTLKGRTLTIFIIWVAGIVASCFIFCVEVLSKSQKR